MYKKMFVAIVAVLLLSGALPPVSTNVPLAQSFSECAAVAGNVAQAPEALKFSKERRALFSEAEVIYKQFVFALVSQDQGREMLEIAHLNEMTDILNKLQLGTYDAHVNEKSVNCAALAKRHMDIIKNTGFGKSPLSH